MRGYRRSRAAINPPPVGIYDGRIMPFRPKRDRSLRVAMTEEELADLRTLADSRGMSVSEWIRYSTGVHASAREIARSCRKQAEEYSQRIEAFLAAHPFEIVEHDEY
jgi:hypothetical protein